MGEECCCWTKWLTWGSVVVLIAVYLFKAILKAVSRPYSQMPQTDNERYFYDPNSKERARFPSILSAPSVYLSVIVPSYNEEARLPIMLDKAFQYLQDRKKRDSKFSYEVIIVDDGSRDATSKVALEYSRKYTTDVCRVLTLEKNRGKGGAVRMGVMKSRGKLILFADADDAARFSDFENLENAINSSEGFEKEDIVVCGSRRSLEKESIAQRSAYRTFLMYGFHFLVWFLCVRGIRDTQCGFKLFTRSAALKCFSNLHVMRWAFDVDLLYIAEHLKMPVHEIDINWHECEGSKLTVASYVQMGIDLLSIRAHYLFGAWKINENYRISD